jgi:hypothetical protein
MLTYPMPEYRSGANQQIICSMNRWGGARWTIAILLISVLIGLPVVTLALAGLGAASEVATLVSLASLAPLTVTAVNRIRRDADSGPAKTNGKYTAPNESAEQEPEIIRSRNLSSGQRFQPVPRVKFRTPTPWPEWLWVYFWSIYIAGGIALITVASSQRSGFTHHHAGGLDILGSVSILVGTAFIVAMALGGFGDRRQDLFVTPRAKLVIDNAGIYYRWNFWSLRRRFFCPWDNIIMIRENPIGRQYGSKHLVIVLADKRGSQTKNREIALCPLDSSGFPRDEILSAIATFEPSLIEPDE